MLMQKLEDVFQSTQIGNEFTFECELINQPKKDILSICDNITKKYYNVCINLNTNYNFDFSKNKKCMVIVSGLVIPMGNSGTVMVLLKSITLNTITLCIKSPEVIKYELLVRDISNIINDLESVIKSSSSISFRKIFNSGLLLHEQLNMAISQSNSDKNSIILSCIIKKLQAIIK